MNAFELIPSRLRALGYSVWEGIGRRRESWSFAREFNPRFRKNGAGGECAPLRQGGRISCELRRGRRVMDSSDEFGAGVASVGPPRTYGPACMADGSDQISDSGGMMKIAISLLHYFAPDAAASVNRGVAPLLQSKCATLRLDE